MIRVETSGLLRVFGGLRLARDHNVVGRALSWGWAACDQLDDLLPGSDFVASIIHLLVIDCRCCSPLLDRLALWQLMMSKVSAIILSSIGGTNSLSV